MISKAKRLTILLVAMMTVLGTGDTLAAYATAYGNNGDDDSLIGLEDRIREEAAG
jgi:hypothetical protein